MLVRMEFWKRPCVICGEKGSIEIDHIIPLAQGGNNSPENLQPLCKICHTRKGNIIGRSNEELKKAFEQDKKMHHLRHEYLLATRFTNSFDAPSFDSWYASKSVSQT